MNNYIDIIVSQNTSQLYAQYISQLHVSVHFRPKHVVVRYIVHIVHTIVLCFDWQLYQYTYFKCMLAKANWVSITKMEPQN